MSTIILTYIALIPPFILMWLIYKQDSVEREPIGLVLQMFILGCLIPILVFAVDPIFTFLLSFLGTGLLYHAAYYFIKVALVEEGGKLLMLRLRIWNNKEFNYRFDGIVYSVAVSIGFASIENLIYVFHYGFSTGLLRAITAIPAHTMFAVFMGYYLGEAKYYAVLQRTDLSEKNMKNAFLVPLLLHGSYDFIATLQIPFFSLIFWIFVGVTDFLAVSKVIQYAKQDLAFSPPAPEQGIWNFSEIDKLMEEIRRQQNKSSEK